MSKTLKGFFKKNFGGICVGFGAATVWHFGSFAEALGVLIVAIGLYWEILLETFHENLSD